jgi:segregation and condensation protein B
MSDINPELKNIIEAALLVAGQPLTLERLQQMFPEESRPAREEIRDVLKRLDEEYADRGLEVKQVEKAYRLQTREKYASWLTRLAEERPARYSRALLETLAIIAYRQPVTRGDIEDIRGVAVSTDIIKTLLTREWVREVGRREVPGRPALYGTTRGFLEYFNLTKLEDLPPLAELRDLAVIGAELEQRADDALGRTAGANDGLAAAAGVPMEGGEPDLESTELASECSTAHDAASAPDADEQRADALTVQAKSAGE